MHTETCLYNTFINRDLDGSPAGEKDHKYMIGYKREKYSIREDKTDRKNGRVRRSSVHYIGPWDSALFGSKKINGD